MRTETVYPTEKYFKSFHESAVALYRKFGFEEEGLIKKYRKLDGQYFDCFVMGRFL